MAYNSSAPMPGAGAGQSSTARAAYFVNDPSLRTRPDRPDYRSYSPAEDYARGSNGSSQLEMEPARTSAASLGRPPVAEQDHGYGYSTKPSPPKRESAVQRLKRRVRTVSESNAALQQDMGQVQHELQHYKDRVTRDEESHRLEIQRLKKEVEYHKRLRLGADQRAFDLEDRLMQQMRHTRSFDDNQRLEAEQALLLHTRNTELSNKVKDLEVQVSQLQGLKSCLEEQLDGALCEKEQLEEELQKAHERAALGSTHLYGLHAMKIDEDEAYGEEEEEEEAGEQEQAPTQANGH